MIPIHPRRRSRSFFQVAAETFESEDDHSKYSYDTETDDNESNVISCFGYSTSTSFGNSTIFATSCDEEEMPSSPRARNTAKPAPKLRSAVLESIADEVDEQREQAKARSSEQRAGEEGQDETEKATARSTDGGGSNNDANQISRLKAGSRSTSGSHASSSRTAKSSLKSRSTRGSHASSSRTSKSSFKPKMPKTFWKVMTAIGGKNPGRSGNKPNIDELSRAPSKDSKALSLHSGDRTEGTATSASEAGTLSTKRSSETGFFQLHVCVMEHGGVDKLNLKMPGNIPKVQRADDVIVAVDASTITVEDCMIRRGQWEAIPPLPFVPGSDMIGTVVDLGPAAKAIYKVGDRVAALPGSGCNANYVTLPVQSLMPVPDGMDPAVALSMLSTYVPARQILDVGRRFNTPYTGANVLIIGWNRAMGLALMELLLLEGGNVSLIMLHHS